jgi:hypothetical protein
LIDQINYIHNIENIPTLSDSLKDSNTDKNINQYNFISIFFLFLNIICIFIRITGTIFILIFSRKYSKIIICKNNKSILFEKILNKINT